MGNFRKSSHSNPNGACVSVGNAELEDGRTSSHSSGQGNCVRAGHLRSQIGVQDTKQDHLGSSRVTLRFTPAAWAEFTSRIKAG